VTLSAQAVAALRFEIRGWKARNPASRLPVYRELAAAGIMEPVPGSEGEYCLTREGLEYGEAILEREAERIERERHEPPDASNLSEAARELLRTCIAGECPEGDEANRPAYRELVAARIISASIIGRDCASLFVILRSLSSGTNPPGFRSRLRSPVGSPGLGPASRAFPGTAGEWRCRRFSL
jgi:hypothetical protein